MTEVWPAECGQPLPGLAPKMSHIIIYVFFFFPLSLYLHGRMQKILKWLSHSVKQAPIPKTADSQQTFSEQN